MSGFEKFGLGQNHSSLTKGKNTRWKPEKGKYRVSFVGITGIENKNPIFDVSKSQINVTPVERLYVQGVGYFVDKGVEFQKLAGGKKGKLYLGVTVCFWPVNSTNGQLDKNRLADGDFEVKNWVMGQDKFNQIASIHQEYPLIEHDLKIDCTDAQFHKMNFSPCRDSIFKKLKEDKTDMFNSVVDIAQVVASKIDTDMAQDLTLEQIREKLTGESSSSSSTPTSFNLGGSTDFEDVLDNVLDD